MRALRAQTAQLGIASAVGLRRGNSLEVLVRSQVEDQREIRHRSGALVPGQRCQVVPVPKFSSLGPHGIVSWIVCTQHVSLHT
jgi:hypothetical protein